MLLIYNDVLFHADIIEKQNKSGLQLHLIKLANI